jgi:hypothetical protein
MGGTWPSIEVRLWSKVDKSGECWTWQGSLAAGYGQIQHNGKMKRVHRLAWELEHGEIPPGMDICHNCPGGDNPLCVRPTHLWLGTQRENIADRTAKGRSSGPLGGRKRTDKVTRQDVIEIRKLQAQGVTQKDLAKRYNVTPTAISLIVSRINWKHVA